MVLTSSTTFSQILLAKRMGKKQWLQKQELNSAQCCDSSSCSQVEPIDVYVRQDVGVNVSMFSVWRWTAVHAVETRPACGHDQPLEHGWMTLEAYVWDLLWDSTPYPAIVHEFQKSDWSEESRIVDLGKRGRARNYVIACVVGSNAISALCSMWLMKG